MSATSSPFGEKPVNARPHSGGQPLPAPVRDAAPNVSRRACSAFSLIEITLALLVFGVGVLAILALFPAGVKLSNDAYMETRMAALAELILNSVAVQIDMDRGFDDNRWTMRTLDFSAPQAGAWDGEADGRLAIIANATNLPGGVATNVYRLLPAKVASVEDFVFRYKLEVKRPTSHTELKHKWRYETVELYQEDFREFCRPREWAISASPTLSMVVTGVVAVLSTNYNPKVQFSTREWISARDHLIRANVAIWPGRYGGQARYFYRYYYLFHP